MARGKIVHHGGSEDLCVSLPSYRKLSGEKEDEKKKEKGSSGLVVWAEISMWLNFTTII